MVEKEVYLRWRDDPCTAELYKEVNAAVEELVSRLVTDLEATEKQTAYIRGGIKGMIEVLEWKPTLVEEEEDA